MNSQVTVGIVKILQMLTVQGFNKMQGKLAKKMLFGSKHIVFFTTCQLIYQAFVSILSEIHFPSAFYCQSMPIPTHSEDNNTKQNLITSECMCRHRRV